MRETSTSLYNPLWTALRLWFLQSARRVLSHLSKHRKTVFCYVSMSGLFLPSSVSHGTKYNQTKFVECRGKTVSIPAFHSLWACVRVCTLTIKSMSVPFLPDELLG